MGHFLVLAQDLNCDRCFNLSLVLKLHVPQFKIKYFVKSKRREICNLQSIGKITGIVIFLKNLHKTGLHLEVPVNGGHNSYYKRFGPRNLFMREN